MTDNFDKIIPLLNWRTSDDFYFLQILQRKKDHKEGIKVNGANNNSRLIKAYYVKSLESLNFYKPKIIELCKLFNARAYKLKSKLFLLGESDAQEKGEVNIEDNQLTEIV